MTEFNSSCPVMRPAEERVLLAHGGGGRLMHQLIERVFVAEWASAGLQARHDGAVVRVGGARLAFTTDSYVVRPLEFPGGNIGDLAVNGTVNDLAMCGARPLYLSAGFILEEGLEIETLRRVARSMRQAAARAGVALVTGDTKVVDKGKGDGIFINTAGIGAIEHGLAIEPASVRAGDAVLLSGDVGRHGIAIVAEREGLAFETTIRSDCAPLAAPVLALLEAGIEIRETAVPVREAVQGACEILGLDPLYVANEGRFVAFVPERDAARALEVLRGFQVCALAARIGAVRAGPRGVVELESRIGGHSILDLLSGEQLPRIC